MIVTDRITSP